MSSEWDLPEARGSQPGAAQQPTRRTARGWPGIGRDGASENRADGAVDPVALFGFVLHNIVRIAAIAVVLTIIGLVALKLIAFPYKATATVLVDPRDQQVTLQQGVLQSIGSDAAILESMVQIMKSDGFLLTVMDQLTSADGGKSDLGETERLEELAKFKKNLTVERKGATYLVEISYKAATAQDAARIANSVADSFAENQNGYLSEATQNAARALSQRLVELRRKLNASEKAVADYAAANGILYIDSNNTLEMRQLTELSALLAIARNATEESRSRYQQQLASSGSDLVLSSEPNGEPAQLAFLRQQRTQLVQTLEQQSLTYGSRHPRIAQTRQLIGDIERQIREEKQLLTKRLKGALDVALAQQAKLETDIAKLSSGVVTTDAAEVRLEALRREAAADREIYEQFLSRNKATDELAELKTENVRVVSPAIPPLNSSRPSTLLMAPILGFLSAVAATALLVAADSGGNENPGSRSPGNPESAPAFDRERRRPAMAADGAPIAAARNRHGGSLLTLWSGDAAATRQ